MLGLVSVLVNMMHPLCQVRAGVIELREELPAAEPPAPFFLLRLVIFLRSCRV